MQMVNFLCFNLQHKQKPYVTQHEHMGQMSAKAILNQVNRCAARSKFVKFLVMASLDFWHILFKIHNLSGVKTWTEKLLYMLCCLFASLTRLQNETYCLKHGFLNS